MKKKILSLLLVAGLSVSLFAGCGSGAADADKATAEGGKEAASDLKIGAILIGDETEDIRITLQKRQKSLQMSISYQ